jgi:dienelactone hydrolase
MAPPSARGACVVLLALVSGAVAAPRDGAPSSARASRSAARVVQPRASDAAPRAARLPPGGETAPGSPDPVSVPFRTTATFHPAYAGAYGAPGPHAPAVTSRGFDLSLRDVAVYGFTRVVAAFPFDHELPDASDATFPVVAWGVGAHNACTHVDNRETLVHLASWGFVALCPEVFPEPYPGDERALFETLRFAVDRKANLSPRLRTSALGIAGYSLGGGRVVRGLASLAAVSDSGSTPESITPINPESCDDAACVAKSVRAAVSLQGWNEGRGGAFATPLLLLGSDDDAVVTRWRDGMARVFDSATGEKILGVVRGGGHNLGPHYFFGWMTAFLRGELYGDADAKEAVFGTDDARSLAPFGEHPNVLTAHRRFLGIDRPGAGKVETFEFENTGSECVAMIPDMSC